MDDKIVGKDIKFHFHPYKYDENQHVIEKADSEGRQRRYLAGISSGLNVDAHGERMSEKCIGSFMNQANSGDILLFPDAHGIQESNDIGILNKAEILPTGDWYTEFRLYDEHDNVGPVKLEKSDTIWKQMNGLPPYQRKRQKGFSIEGIIPDTAIIASSVTELDRSVIDDVMLDGVVLVPRPAYKDSIATAVYKALGETTPYRRESIQTTIRENVELQDIEDNYYKYKWQYLDALEQNIELIMTKVNNNKSEELQILFDEYSRLMTNLILNSERMFVKEQNVGQIIDITTPDDNTYSNQVHSASIEEESNLDQKVELFKSLYNKLNNLANYLER